MPYWCNYKIDFTEEELLKENEQWLGKEEFFKYNGKYIDGKQWYNILKSSIKKAVTIEELQPYEIPTAYLSIWKGSEHTYTSSVILNNSSDLQSFIAMYNAKVENGEIEGNIYPVISFPVEKFAHQKSKKVRQPKTKLTEYFAVKVDKGHTCYYVQQLTAKQLRGTYYKENAKQFKTEKEAYRWLNEKDIEKRFRVSCSLEKICAAA